MCQTFLSPSTRCQVLIRTDQLTPPLEQQTFIFAPIRFSKFNTIYSLAYIYVKAEFFLLLDSDPPSFIADFSHQFSKPPRMFVHALDNFLYPILLTGYPVFLAQNGRIPLHKSGRPYLIL